MKQCKDCLQNKELTEFYHNKVKGYERVCKECRKRRQQANKQKADRRKENDLSWRFKNAFFEKDGKLVPITRNDISRLLGIVALICMPFISLGQIVPDTTNKPLIFPHVKKVNVCIFYTPIGNIACMGNYHQCLQTVPEGIYIVRCGNKLFTINKKK